MTTKTFPLPLPTDGTALVEYDHQPEEKQTLEYPGCPETITPLRAFVNGYWHDLEDLAATFNYDTVIEKIQESLGDEEWPSST